MTLWIVEDNTGDVFLIQEALVCAGFDFHAVPIATGDEVIARIQSLSEDGSEAPDAIILDLHLVKYTGAQLLKRIRSYASMEHIFIVVLTASNAPGERKQAEEFGANAYFRKSLDLDEFMSVGHDIAAILKQRLS